MKKQINRDKRVISKFKINEHNNIERTSFLKISIKFIIKISNFSKLFELSTIIFTNSNFQFS